MDPSEDRLYTYVVVRKDIPTTYRIIQAAHAVQEISLDQVRPRKCPIHMVLLEAHDEQELSDMYYALGEEGVIMRLFFEPDYGTGYSAMASRLMEKDDPLREKFRQYRMYR